VNYLIFFILGVHIPGILNQSIWFLMLNCKTFLNESTIFVVYKLVVSCPHRKPTSKFRFFGNSSKVVNKTWGSGDILLDCILGVQSRLPRPAAKYSVDKGSIVFTWWGENLKRCQVNIA
jgi:hypothetical protein